jgi:hypothetical protein
MEHMLASQICALAWIRCLQEEGYNFINKETGHPEKDERVIYEAFETQSGLFDMPAAKASRYGLEKNLLEVYGSYCLYNDDEELLSLLFSRQVKRHIKDNINTLKKEKG